MIYLFAGLVVVCITVCIVAEETFDYLKHKENKEAEVK